MSTRIPGAAISEDAFQAQVVELAELYRWLPYHTHDSRRSNPGFPDLVLVRAPELIFAELKTEKGRVRPDQQAWLAQLGLVAAAAVGIVEVHLWRPSDWAHIQGRLARSPLK